MRKKTIPFILNSNEKNNKVWNDFVDRVELKFHDYKIKINRYSNKFGLFFFKNIEINVKKIEKELSEIDDASISMFTNPSSVTKSILILDGYQETINKKVDSGEIRRLERMISHLPSFIKLSKKLKNKQYYCVPEFIHSSKSRTFKGLYIHLRKI